MDENKLNQLHKMLVEKLKGIAPDMDMQKIVDAAPDLIDTLSSREKIEANYFRKN